MSLIFWMLVACLVVFGVFAAVSLSFFCLFYFITKNMVASVIGQILCSALAILAGRRWYEKNRR